MFLVCQAGTQLALSVELFALTKVGIQVRICSIIIQRNTGVYIKFKIHIFVPPPFFSSTEIYYNEGVRAAGEKFEFFLQFLYFKSIWEKVTLPIGGKICISPPFFYPLSVIFFSNLLFGHILGSNRKTPLIRSQLKLIILLFFCFPHKDFLVIFQGIKKI